MKRFFDTVMQDPDGHIHIRKLYQYDAAGLPLLETLPNGQRGQVFDRFEPMTMRHYVIDALSGRWPGEEKAGWDQVKRRGELLDKITFSPNGWAEVSAADCQMVKDALEHQGVSYYVMYRIGMMLETDPPKESPDEASREPQ